MRRRTSRARAGESTALLQDNEEGLEEFTTLLLLFPMILGTVAIPQLVTMKVDIMVPTRADFGIETVVSLGPAWDVGACLFQKMRTMILGAAFKAMGMIVCRGHVEAMIRAQMCEPKCRTTL